MHTGRGQGLNERDRALSWLSTERGPPRLDDSPQDLGGALLARVERRTATMSAGSIPASASTKRPREGAFLAPPEGRDSRAPPDLGPTPAVLHAESGLAERTCPAVSPPLRWNRRTRGAAHHLAWEWAARAEGPEQ